VSGFICADVPLVDTGPVPERLRNAEGIDADGLPPRLFSDLTLCQASSGYVRRLPPWLVTASRPVSNLGVNGRCARRSHCSIIIQFDSGINSLPVLIAGVGTMDPYQWFLLGMMVAWTPGLVALALILRDAEDPD